MKIINRRLAVAVATLSMAVIIIYTVKQNPPTDFAYIPAVQYGNDCQEYSIKKGVAISNYDKGGLNFLCLYPDPTLVPCHRWDSEDIQLPLCHKYSMLWGGPPGGSYDAWIDYVTEEGCPEIALFLNEPDRPDQADMTPTQAADLYLYVSETVCPSTKWVGPMTSDSDNGQWVRTFLIECGMIGCDTSNTRLIAFSVHAYTNMTFPTIDSRLDSFCTFVVCDRKFWVTEVGLRSFISNPYTILSNWIEEMDNDPRIEKYFGYTTYSLDAQYHAFFDWNTNDMTEFGCAFAGISQSDCETAFAYPAQERVLERGYP